MSVFRHRRRGRGKPRLSTPVLVVIAIVAVAALGLVITDRDTNTRPSEGPTSPPAGEVTAQFVKCGRERFTCVVDGDTVWFEGQNLRLQSYDTPEPHDNICGGAKEVALANQASARLIELLNSNPFVVETFGVDGTGERTLATIRIAGRDVGDILIEERLARRWPDGREWWCD